MEDMVTKAMEGVWWESVSANAVALGIVELVNFESVIEEGVVTVHCAHLG
jgi:hypothetical protein